MEFGSVLYESKDRVATITLNRPERFNAISEAMPEDIASAFDHAGNDDSVHVVVLTGASRGFCGGYDLKAFAEKPGANPGIQDIPWDPMIDYSFMNRCTQNFMSIWRCNKPVIGRINGDAVAGGSDIVLCCDIIIMNERARIGYPPSRVWGYARPRLCGSTVLDWKVDSISSIATPYIQVKGLDNHNNTNLSVIKMSSRHKLHWNYYLFLD